ncbi:spore protease YyaC [Anaerobacillus alkalidiazotrophicus]|uniref:Spore protease YyaC n=1 Tax=Anaerobacillus alkalidiazotrophicus TaxID=472963 RepID=A0A1S2MB67_9BACI|nr:spore protease YyaC [Anaerobacillus alkalidiazotrophicus]OIJ21909.1 spore protease YyaC [Anaerobacillus alkalidiazotrophicus]
MITRNFFKKKQLPFRVHIDEKNAAHDFANQILHLLPKLSNRDLVIVCIGTDRSTGDSLGPLIGSKLIENKTTSFYIYGTLEDPVHAVNLEEKVAQIFEKHDNPFVIGIDACLGRSSSVGIMSIDEGPVKPGAAVNKKLPPIGDIHITGIVNVAGFMEYMVLQNTRLHFVIKLASKIAESIVIADQRLNKERQRSFLDKGKSSLFTNN